MIDIISEKAQSPVILPPETLSKNWISRQVFDPSQDITFSFEPKTLSDEKEITFGAFLINSKSTKIFGGTTVKGGLYDYSSKGEIGEGLSINDSKYQTNISGQTYDILLDHVYPNDIQDLINNQNPFNTNNFENPYIFSIFFDSTKKFFKSITDAFGNQYFDSVKPIDLISDEIITDIDNYQAPMFIQAKENIYIIDLIIDNIPLTILDFKNYTIRFTLKDKGRILNCSFLKAGETTFKDFFTREINLDLDDINNLRFGFGITSPVFSYDKNKKAAEKPADLLRYFTIQGKHSNS